MSSPQLSPKARGRKRLTANVLIFRRNSLLLQEKGLRDEATQQKIKNFHGD